MLTSSKELRRDTRPQTVCVGSLSRVVDVPGWYPEGDDNAVHNGKNLRAYNETFKDLREAHAQPHQNRVQEDGPILASVRRC